MSLPARRGEELHRAMVKFLPETDSKYAKYPMKREKWLHPNEESPTGEPCFQAATSNQGFRQDYVYGQGINGKGYYHILTRNAQTALYSKIQQTAPGGCCCFGNSDYDEWDDVKRVMYGRYKCTVPDDALAAEAALREAQGMANAWHNGLQVEGFVASQFPASSLAF